MATQVGFWDGSVAVVRLQPSTAPSPPTPAVPEEEQVASAGSGPDRELQRDMVLLTHFQVDPLPLRAVAWCPPQVNPAPPLPSPLPCPPPLRQPFLASFHAVPASFLNILLLLLQTETGECTAMGRDISVPDRS